MYCGAEIPYCFFGQFHNSQQGFHRVIGLASRPFIRVDQAARR